MRRDEYVVANDNVAEDSRECTNLGPISQSWVSFAGRVGGYARGPENDTAEDVAVVADTRRLTDHRTPPVIQNQAPANMTARMNFGA